MNKLTEVSIKNGCKATCNHNRKLIYSLSLILLIFFLTSSAQAKYSGGTGEPNDPYQIADANDMNEIGTHIEDWNDCFVLVNDINLADYTGTQFNIIGTSSSNAFTGVFDGNGLTISNFTYNSVAASYIGIFGYVYDPNALIKNLTLIDPNVAAGTGDYVGPLVGRLKRGTIRNCSVQGGGSSGQWYVGGLVGDSYRDCTVSDCYANVTVSGFRDVGMLAGRNQLGSVISDCHVAGNVSGVGNGLGGLVGWNSGSVLNCYVTGTVLADHDYVGGLIGINYFGTISNCHATVVVEGEDIVGGLVGENQGPISRCSATGTVSGTGYYVGGLVGNNSDAFDIMGVAASILNSYATASVSGDIRVGGLIGDSYDAAISNCYAAGSVSGMQDIGGLVGVDGNGSYTKCFWDSDVNTGLDGISNKSDPNVMGKTTVEMQKEATFTGWDFVEIWNIGENQTYPYLRVYPAGDLNHNSRVDFDDFAILANNWLAGVE